MTTNKTEIVFILDRSGSMGGLEADTIGGFNAMLAKQQAEPGEARLTTVLFDDRCETLHDRLDIRAVRPITQREYFVRGSTALLDAVGRTIKRIVNAQRQSKPEYRADNVIFVITTDGMENASREYTYAKVKSMIEHEKRKYGWEFIFLGANIDAVEIAGRFGIGANRAQNYCNDRDGIALNYIVVGDAVASFRASASAGASAASLPDDWNAEIDRDFKRRGGQR